MDGKPIYINDLTVGRYDCRVKIGPSYATKRQESAESLMAFMQAMPQAAPLIGDLVATNMDWPGAESIAERLRRAVPPQILGEDAPPQPPNPEAEAQAQAQKEAMEGQLAELKAKIEKMMADTEKAAADAEKTRADTDKIRAETHKLHVETEMMPHDRVNEIDRYHTDRMDRQQEAEASRTARLQEFSERNSQATNGSARPFGESNY